MPAWSVRTENRTGAGDDAQHFHRQCRDQRILRFHHHRHPADDAIALRVDGEQPAAGRRVFDGRNVPQQTRKRHQIGSRIGAANGEAGMRRRVILRARCRGGGAGLANHDAAGTLYGVGENDIVARQPGELVEGLLIKAAKTLRGDGRRHPIGFGEDDIEADRDGAELPQLRDQIGNDRAGPRPLPDLLQARFVDIDDDNRPRGLFARTQNLKKIEGAQS